MRKTEELQKLYDELKHKNLRYKMGVVCGEMLYSTMKFDDFHEMVQEAERISERYDDIQRCSFVFQAYRDDSYNFETVCFFQTKCCVYDIRRKVTDMARCILEKLKGGE